MCVFWCVGKKGTDDEAEAEALRRQVFSNEKGFLESSAFNPARAREEREEEEARALAAQWGSTPQRAKEVIRRTKEDKDLSFQVRGKYEMQGPRRLSHKPLSVLCIGIHGGSCCLARLWMAGGIEKIVSAHPRGW